MDETYFAFAVVIGFSVAVLALPPLFRSKASMDPVWTWAAWTCFGLDLASCLLLATYSQAWNEAPPYALEVIQKLTSVAGKISFTFLVYRSGRLRGRTERFGL